MTGSRQTPVPPITAVGSLTKTANETTLKPGEEVTYSLLVFTAGTPAVKVDKTKGSLGENRGSVLVPPARR